MTKKLRIESLFPLIVILFSCIEIYKQQNLIHIPALIISILGIVGGILYFLKVKYYNVLFYIWIISQVVVINSWKVDETTGLAIENKIWDTSQFFKSEFGITNKTLDSQNGFYINLVPFFMLGLLKKLNVSDLIGAKITCREYQKENQLENTFLFDGVVKKRVTLSKEKDWLLVELETPFTFEELEISNVFIKSKDDTALKKGKKGQLASLMIIENIDDINFDMNLNKNEFKYIETVIIE